MGSSTGRSPWPTRSAPRSKTISSATAWLDDATRATALQKLSALGVGVSAPLDFTPYETRLTTLSPSLDVAGEAIMKDARQRALARIGAIDTRLWHMTPVTVNAAYFPSYNQINLPAAILQAPRYKPEWPDAVSYGALGTLIGHELTHGFDDQGSQFDASGSLTNWWSDHRAHAVR